jgi:hypothetical protein
MDKKLGVIVPYRDRYEHLQKFKQTIIPYLKERGIDFELIVVEQDDSSAFNRGKLLNVGFLYAKKIKCDYVVFHDVDMLPVDVDYSYSDIPIQMATNFVGETNRLIFDGYFGGVTMFPVDSFEHINGYSNDYWGWGYEDDDLLFRCKVNGVPLDTKKIEMKGGNVASLKFNGVDAHVKGTNFFKQREEMTIFISFYPDELVCDFEEKSDKYSLFTIPGYDFTITYNSYSRYTVEVFDGGRNIIYQYSNIKTNYRTNITVTINPTDKVIKFYQDGDLVSQDKFTKLYEYTKEPHFYLGVGSPIRKRENNYYRGLISSFAVFDKELSYAEIREISDNHYFGLTQSFGRYTSDYALKLYYDAKFIKGYKLMDLSGNGNDGEIINCEIVGNTYDEFKIIDVPFRRQSTFKLLTHEENGFVKDGWKSDMTRFNQLRFYNEVIKGYRNIKEDGLSNCKYKQHSISKVENQVNIIVGL